MGVTTGYTVRGTHQNSSWEKLCEANEKEGTQLLLTGKHIYCCFT